MVEAEAPYHAHIYYSPMQRSVAEALREQFRKLSSILFVGAMIDHGIGPHPVAQYEIHFLKSSVAQVIALIEPTGLRALVHPLTDDDLADHTSLGHWIGEPVALDLSVLDPPGRNKGLARFGLRDF
jgi:aromatic ring-cleaving dioxygenase